MLGGLSVLLLPTSGCEAGESTSAGTEDAGAGGTLDGGHGGGDGGGGGCEEPAAPPLAVPGALGFGRHVRGAYAGSDSPTVLIVDDLRSDAIETGTNRGTLRWALTRSFPRVILFEVSGYIDLDTFLLVRSDLGHDFVSIYGQTAPGKGITVTGDRISLRANQVLIQHLRFRSSITGSGNIDALDVDQGSHVFIDHCSSSYADDENIGVGGSEGTFVGPITISNSILSHPQHGPTGKGILMGGTVDHASVVRNAFVHCAIRHPHIGDDTYSAAEIVNNLIYNPAWEGSAMEKGNAPAINFIGNVLKPGPDTNNPSGRQTGILTSAGIHSGARLYVMDNLCPARVPNDEWSAIRNDTSLPSSHYAVSTPFDYDTDALAAAGLEAYLAANAGAFYWSRDDVDAAAVSDMVQSTGSWIQTLAEASYPALPELQEELTLPGQPHGDDDCDGYTNLEGWVQSFVP